MSFASVMAVLLPYEDFYTNDSTDRGGETLWGISRVQNLEAACWPVLDALKAKGVPQVQWRTDKALNDAVTAFYWAIWSRHDLDYIPDQLQGPLFGGIVNQGDQVIYDLQDCLLKMHQMVDRDGQVGPATLAAVNKVEAPILAELLWKRRGEGYLAVVDKHPDQSVNLHGWFNRLRKGL